MSEKTYIRPPIVQALFEARFDGLVDIKKIKKFTKNISGDYPSLEEEKRYDVLIKKGVDVTASASFSGYKLSSLEGTDLILVRPDVFGVGRLAPYEGWDSFCSTLKKNWEEAKKVFGYRPINRLALRYINRIDIPCDVRPVIEEDVHPVIEETDYVNISIAVPKDVVNVFQGYRIEFAAKTEKDILFTVRTGASKSPMVDHIGIILDLDIYKVKDLPQKDGDMWNLLNELRLQKNSLFERFVTNKSRELFDRKI